MAVALSTRVLSIQATDYESLDQYIWSPTQKETVFLDTAKSVDLFSVL
jgi:hypothetical protein